MDKLIELANAGVTIVILGPAGMYAPKWHVNIKKNNEGTELTIKTEHVNPQSAIDDAYERWIKATGKGIPNLTLKQIDYIPPASLDDEIPS